MTTFVNRWGMGLAAFAAGACMLACEARAQTPLRPDAARSPAVPELARRALQLAPIVDAVAVQHDIDPLLLHAIAFVESRHNAGAVSRAGARGVMQVMPGTARRFGVSNAGSLHDARVNLDVSATYLKTLQQRFGNDLPLVLAAYNAGEGAVEHHGRQVPPFEETRAYVREVLARYDILRAAARRVRRARIQARRGTGEAGEIGPHPADPS